ncbi:MAG: hypothetical protein U0804_18895 [Gemmataceae bacterium]
MNPLVLVAALAAVPVPAPETRADFTPIPANATRQIVCQLRVVTLQGEAPADLGADALLAEAERRGTVQQLPRVTLWDGQSAKVFNGTTRTFTTGVAAALKDGAPVVVPTTKTVDVGARFELAARVTGGAVVGRLKHTDTRVVEPVRAVALNLRHVGPDGLERVGVETIAAPEVTTQATDAAVRLRSGGTLVVAGPVRTEEFRTERLLRVPFASRLFTTVGTDRLPVRTYLLLTVNVVEDDAVPVAPAPRPVGR